MPTEFQSWPDQVRERILCVGSTTGTEIELNNFIIYNKIARLMARCPEIFADEEPNGLAYAYSQIGCGELLNGFPLARVTALLSHYELLCEQETLETQAAANWIVAAGIWTSGGTGTTQDITGLTGVLATDSVVATLHTKIGTEEVVTAITAANKVTVVFSAAPTTGTKVNYQVVRNPA